MRTAVILIVMLFTAFGVQAQYDNYPNDRYYYQDEFDWRWDVRVRISDGIRQGLITQWEARRLYNQLERIEEDEYRYQADGRYTRWEQDRIWEQVVMLNRRLGMELSDWDRRYYGYLNVTIGYLPWYGSRYDFYRFDRRGYGNMNRGYAPRHYYPKRGNHYTYRNQSPYRYQNDNWRNNRNYNYTRPNERLNNGSNNNQTRPNRNEPRIYDRPNNNYSRPERGQGRSENNTNRSYNRSEHREKRDTYNRGNNSSNNNSYNKRAPRGEVVGKNRNQGNPNLVAVFD